MILVVRLEYAFSVVGSQESVCASLKKGTGSTGGCFEELLFKMKVTTRYVAAMNIENRYRQQLSDYYVLL